jgi:hypothetical protein
MGLSAIANDNNLEVLKDAGLIERMGSVQGSH